MSVIVGPTGEIVSKQWKARNILGLFGEGALIGTTVYDVLDRYVEMYGWDATMPVARTDIGNIAMTAVGGEPLLYQCLALKGAEIMILTVTGGNNPESAMAAARASRVYTVGVGNSVSPDNPGFAEAAGSEDEGTIIADPRGVPLARSANHHEDFVSARVPIADFRKTRRFPEYPMALFLPVLQQYEPKFGPNTFLAKLPKDYREAGEIVRARMNAKEPPWPAPRGPAAPGRALRAWASSRRPWWRCRCRRRCRRRWCRSCLRHCRRPCPCLGPGRACWPWPACSPPTSYRGSASRTAWSAARAWRRRNGS
jgi:hypothetical protein